jgi:hypothetical protein
VRVMSLQSLPYSKSCCRRNHGEGDNRSSDSICLALENHVTGPAGRGLAIVTERVRHLPVSTKSTS